MTDTHRAAPRTSLWVRAGALPAMLLGSGLALSSLALAQTAAQPSPTWGPAEVKKSPQVAGIVLDDKQTAALKDVSKYFTDLKQLKGNFTQTNADGKRLRGKFLVKQPGRFRFDYGSGSKMIIVSDGQFLSIQDLDLKTDSSWELDRTPFRLLLRKDVDLVRDAAIIDVQDADDLIIVSLQDKSPDTPGRIKLFLGKKPTLELKEWVTTDAQGIDTRIEIFELNRTEEIAAELFKPLAPQLQKIQQNQ